MAINLTVAELDTLAVKRAQAQSNQIGYWQIYQWLGDLLQAKGDASSRCFGSKKAPNI